MVPSTGSNVSASVQTYTSLPHLQKEACFEMWTISQEFPVHALVSSNSFKLSACFPVHKMLINPSYFYKCTEGMIS